MFQLWLKRFNNKLTSILGCWRVYQIFMASGIHFKDFCFFLVAISKKNILKICIFKKTRFYYFYWKNSHTEKKENIENTVNIFANQGPHHKSITSQQHNYTKNTKEKHFNSFKKKNKNPLFYDLKRIYFKLLY